MLYCDWSSDVCSSDLFFFVQYYVFSIFQTRSYQWLSFRKHPTTAMPNPRTPRTYPPKLFVVTAIPKGIIAIPNNSILIPFIANTFVTNWNLKTIKLWVIIALHRLSIKSSKSLENKGFIAMCSPYPFIWFHTSLLFPCLLIRAKSRARKSHNKI